MTEPDAWTAQEKFDTGDYESSFERIFSPEKPESENLTEKGNVIYEEVQPLFSEDTIEQEIDRQIDSISDEIDDIEENIIKEEEGREARRHVRKWKCKQIESLKELKELFKQKGGDAE